MVKTWNGVLVGADLYISRDREWLEWTRGRREKRSRCVLGGDSMGNTYIDGRGNGLDVRVCCR